MRGDDRKLRQVLINLLGNALKFTESGEIRLEVEQRDRRYLFRVEDTGPGISDEARERIFESFQQAEEGNAKGGTGLGLAITLRQVELMGGALELESALGEGSRFQFALELAPAERALNADEERARTPVHLLEGHRVRALVVDDVEDNREVLSGFLERAGVQVAAAENGAVALDRIAASRPDIVFMDVRMPVMDGLTAVRELRARWSADPIVCVAITASGLLRQRAFYLDAGFDDFVAKPFRFDAICDCIHRHLGVEFERLTGPAGAAELKPEEAGLEEVRLPAALRKRLLEAAQLNALTEIEAVIAELKQGESGARVLAEELDRLLARYDTDAIIELVARLGADAGQPV